MAERKIRQHVGFGNEIVGVQITQRARLHRAAKIKRRGFEYVRQVGDDHLADGLADGAIEDEAKCAFRIVFADEDDGALKKRATKLPAVEQQLTLQRFSVFGHCYDNLHQKCPSGKKEKTRRIASPRFLEFPRITAI